MISTDKTILALAIPLALACNVEQAIQELIDEHGITWDTSAADSTGGIPTTDGGWSPTTSAAEAGGDGGSGPTSDASTSTGAQLDLPPALEFSVTPEDVQSAMFVDLAATCEDDVAVAEVRFSVDGVLLATVAAPPFEAKWPVKSTDEDGPRTVRAECEDTVGHVVFDEKVIGVTLPESGSEAWSVLMPSKNWSTEALDASAAPDGSWWVCGYDSDGAGEASMWVAHFGPDGAILFNELISRGPGFYGTCSGIEVFPDDPHRAALTGSWIKDGLSPLLWTGVVDETHESFVIAKNEDNYLGEVGNDVAVTVDHQVRITGYRLAGSNSILTYRAFTFSEGETHLAHFAADEYDSLAPGDLKLDAGEAIVALPDGSSLIAGRAVDPKLGLSRGIVALVGANHQIVKDPGNGWPFMMTLTQPESEGYGDITVTPDGLVAVAGWWSQFDQARRPRLVHFDLTDPANVDAYTQPALGDDFVGQSLARLSTGPVMVAATRSDPVEKDDIWIEQYTADGWNVNGEDEVWPKTFTGFFHGNDAPHAIRVNALDTFLVVGYETIQTVKDGQPVTIRQAWLRGFEG
ncbi:Ig-like domain-containing protein [Nannocystis pusilla]|uniref:Ig-like domain-containing protein n=1 Tax=Nannocystis pusilla TaxID=889268 RepID=A0A9X3J409_9BACT|nr:Ig-like domain-containing protein [Nannocystis pusilla]MCY1013394.1 Ig-like domain-containing protein [Nannocystis pusilla]